MSQQKLIESPQHHAETNTYEMQGAVESLREYPAREQNNEFIDRHLFGEKVQPQPDKKSALWALIPLLVLLFLVGGSVFGFTTAFNTIHSAPVPWHDDDFAPEHGWHHLHCQIITDPDQQSVPDPARAHLKQGDDSDHFVIGGKYICDRP